MIRSEVLAIAYGLASAASWGSGDFSAGVASRRGNVFSVVIVSQFIGGMFLVGLAFTLGEKVPSLDNLLLGAVAGVVGVTGLVALYSGFVSGRIGVVAPVAAVVAAVIPIGVGLFTEGLPSNSQLVGFGLGVIAVWLISSSSNGESIRARELGLALIAGLGFGLYFVLIDRVSESAVLWPLVAARAASVCFLVFFAMARRQLEAPAGNQLPIIALAGLFDAGGNAFFVLSTRLGRLDIAAVLSSLYPAMTVLLAWLVLKEGLLPRQWLGVVAAVVALVFIAWGI